MPNKRSCKGGTFVSAAGGTFNTVMPGTFHSVLGGTIKPLPSANTYFENIPINPNR